MKHHWQMAQEIITTLEQEPVVDDTRIGVDITNGH